MANQFILASASPRRLQLLKQIGIVPADVIPAEIDETPRKAELPDKYALRCAEAKASLIAGKHPDAIVLAADTVVACGRRILPKAEDEKTTRKCLALLSGRRHRVYTGICVISPLRSPLEGEQTRTSATLREVRVVGGSLSNDEPPPTLRASPLRDLRSAAPPQGGSEVKKKIVMTAVRFNRIDNHAIDQYIASGEWRGKAGGYAIQGLAESFIPWISGSYSNVVGLPLVETCQLLAQYGIKGMIR